MSEIIPKKDIIFKKIFGSRGNEEILKDFLEYILEIKIETLNLDLSTELLPDFYDGKSSRIDVRAQLDDGTQVDIEMQVDKGKYSEKRCLYYWSKLYASSIEKSEKYETLKKTICLWIVDGLLYDTFKEYESTWKMHESKIGLTGYFNEIEMHIIELKKFRETDIIKPKKKEFWLWFLDYTNKEMIDMACISNERIREAREQLDKITSDRDLMLAIVNQEMFEMDQAVARDNAIKEGMKEGIKQGKKEGMKEGMKEGIKQGKKEGMKEGMKEGIKQGKKEGMKQGKKEEKLEIAKNMKSMNIDIDVIMKATGLTREEIENL